MIPFETEHLLIRHIESYDWSAMLEIGRDFLSSPYYYMDSPHPEDEESARLKTTQVANSLYSYVVCDKETRAVIGYVTFHDVTQAYEMGYCFHSRWHHKGLAYEGVSALLDYMASTGKDIVFVAGTGLDNHPSVRFLERLGFELRETEKLYFHVDEKNNPMWFHGGWWVKKSGRESEKNEENM